MESFRTLATIELVRRLQSAGVKFSMEYKLVADGDPSNPEYECYYDIPDSQEFGVLGRSLLVPTKIPPTGTVARRFKLWPGLLNHHKEFGDGSRLCIDVDTFEISCLQKDQSD